MRRTSTATWRAGRALRCRSVSTWQRSANSLPLYLATCERSAADLKRAAFFGDKLLGWAVALAQQRRDTSAKATMEELAVLHSKARCSKFLHSKRADILPMHAHWESQSQGHPPSHHQAGTMVEAVVASVHDEGGHEAIADLAAWLVDQAGAAAAAESSPSVAAKTKLLELGGTVSVERVGGPDHEPIFQAVAELAGQRVMAKAAGTKSSIERRVAAQLLNTVFADDY